MRKNVIKFIKRIYAFCARMTGNRHFFSEYSAHKHGSDLRASDKSSAGESEICPRQEHSLKIFLFRIRAKEEITSNGVADFRFKMSKRPKNIRVAGARLINISKPAGKRVRSLFI